MNRKIASFLFAYSNGILIILIVLTFMSLLHLNARSRQETLGKIVMLEDLYARDYLGPEELRQASDVFNRSYTGEAGKSLERKLELFRRALESFETLPSNEARDVEKPRMRSLLRDIVAAYIELLRRREYVFDTLFYFLAIGILIQSVTLLLSLSKVRKTRTELGLREGMLSLVQNAREAERQGIASYIHDSILQDLGGLGLHPAVRNDPEARRILNSSIDRLRRMSYSLAPLHLEQAGLEESLRELSAEAANAGGTRVEFSSNGYRDEMIGPEVRLALFRAAQEGLNNIRKHARASRAEIRLVASHPFLLLTIRDNGRGFDPRKVRMPSDPESGGLGLALLERQIKGIGAELVLRSSPGDGTRIQIRYKMADAP